MFRKPGDEPKTKQSINCLISDGGMGDLLCSLPAINYMQKNCPWINLLIWTPDYLVDFFKHTLPKGSIVRGFSDAEKKYDNDKYTISTKWYVNGVARQFTPMKTHPVQYSFNVLADYQPTIEEMSYLKIRPDEIDISKFNLPEKFVVFPAAATEFVKTIPKETIDTLTEYVISNGYTPVFLGKTLNPAGAEDVNYRAEAQDYDFTKSINLMNKTTVLESAAIIAKSKLFIGIDSGLAHLAGFTDTSAVVYYSFVKAVKQVPIRDGIVAHNWYPIETSLGCGGCQSKWVQLEHDFRECFYGDYECVSTNQCSAQKFIDIIEKHGLL